MPAQRYRKSELRGFVLDAVGELLRHDRALLELRAHEQAISHRIAVYLEPFFRGDGRLKIDCEYSKHLERTKAAALDGVHLQALRTEYPGCPCDACEQALEDLCRNEKRFRPDVLVHSRRNNGVNLIAVEVKQKKVCPFDLAKLEALTRSESRGGGYRYKVGAFVYFPDRRPEIIWR